MSTRLLRWLAVFATVVTILLVLGGVWWWALLGMNSDVAGAVKVTAMVSAIGAVAAWTFWSEVQS